MQRDVSQLSSRTFDVLVVGGGVYGLTIAYDAAQRGLATALVERHDFGSGASFNHLRTIHGGLRYLQRLDLARARESVRERRTLARIAPQTVRAVPFALPLYRSLMAGKMAMRAGMLLDRLVAAGRNDGVPAALAMPPGRVLSRAQAVDRFPGLRRHGLTGAAVFYDYVTTESDRLTFSWALAASQCGAVLANHVNAEELLVDGGRVRGVRAHDRLSGRSYEVAARVVVNATGGNIDRLPAAAGAPGKTPMLKAMNLVTRREAGGEALGGRTKSGRHLFLVPWRGRALFGTWESARACEGDDTAIDESEVSGFIRELNEAFPALDLTLGDVTLVHRGVVPAVAHADGRLTLQGHEQIIDHAARGLPGLMSIAGAKYTTARASAQRVVDRVMVHLQHAPVPCHTAERPLPGGTVRDFDLAVAEARREYDTRLPSDTIPHLIAAYGSRYREVLEAAAQSAWLERLTDRSPVIGAEIVWAARHEMARTLADAVVRRTPLGALEYPGDAAASAAAALMAAELGWPAEHTAAELAGLRAFYQGTWKALKT